jgi:hypothetical protein
LRYTEGGGSEVVDGIRFCQEESGRQMRPRSIVRLLLVLTLIVGPATPALANALANWLYVWPGVVSIDPIFGLLPTVLVALIERPFVSLAGVDKQPLLRSIRANLLSLLAGFPVACYVWSVESSQGMLVLTVVAVTITIVVEIAYLRSVMRKESRKLRWWWIVLGNVVSNLVLIGISWTVKTLNSKYPDLGNAIRPYEWLFMLLHLAISGTAVAAALGGPIWRWLQWVPRGSESRPPTT